MVGQGDWQLVSPTTSGWFLRRDWKDGMGGGGTLDGGEPFSSWTEHEDGRVLYVKDMLLRCPWPAGKEE